MARNWQNLTWKLGMMISLFTGGVFTYFGNSALAQITPDRTLGTEGSVVTPLSPNIDRIDGGAIRGSNVFHSFEDFNVNEGRGAYFANPAGIENILSRVTGANPSKIFGTLGVLGNANLYLLNPNGIIFGPNARLDIRGSFVGSTADGIKFGDRTLFRATDTQTKPLLTVAVPVGLQYGTQQAGAISNAGNLAVGQDLTLSAGNLDLQGRLEAGRNLTLQATDTVRVRDSVANPFLARAGGDLLIKGNQGIDILALNHPGTPFQSGSNLSLVSDGIISGDAHFASGRNFSISNLEGKPGNFVSLYDPIISATGDVTFNDYEGAALKVEATGSINGGNIRITRPDTSLSGSDPDIAILTSSPALILRSGLTTLTNASNIPKTEGGIPFTPAGGQSPNGGINVGNINTSSSVGDGGSVTLSAPGDITTGYILTAPTNSTNAANVSITSQNGSININNINNDTDRYSILARSISINSPGIISITGFLNARTDVTGEAGDVVIGDRNNSLAPSSITLAGISTRNGGGGNGGNININSTGTFEAKGAFLESTGKPVDTSTPNSLSVASQASRNGGEINISADKGITVAAGINSNNCFNGNNCESSVGGNITLISNGNIRTGFISAAATNNSKFADVSITSRSGSININGFNNDISRDSIFAKKITINTLGSLFVIGDLNARSDGSGLPASITIGNDLRPTSVNVGVITTRNLNDGNGGNGGDITIRTTGFLNVTNPSKRDNGEKININNEPINDGFNIGTEADVNGGEINIIADGGINTVAGIISNSRGSGNGGNITLRSGNGAINIGAGTVDSSSQNGNGGNIILDAASNINVGSIFSFSSGIGKGGNISLISQSGNINTTAGILNASSINTFGIPFAQALRGIPFNNGGNIFLEAKNGDILSGSIESTGLQGGSITLNSGSKISVNNNDIASITTGLGIAGEINLIGREISLTNTRVGSLSTGEANGGNIFVRGSEKVNFLNEPNSIFTVTSGSSLFDNLRSNQNLQGTGIFTTILPITGDSANITTGNVTLETRQLTINNKAPLGSNSRAGIGTLTLPSTSNNAGNIKINASEFVEISGNDDSLFNPAPSQDLQTNIKNARQIQGIRTGITSATQGSGNAGQIEIETGQLNIKNGAAITSGVTENGTGQGNSIIVNRNFNPNSSIELRGRAAIATATLTSGSQSNASDLTVNAGNIKLSDGALIAADTLGAGTGGNLNIDTNQLNLLSGSRISAATFGGGQGGSVTINSPQRKAQIVNIDGTLPDGQLPGNGQARSGIFTDSRGANSKAGNIDIFTNRLNIENRGEISVSSFDTGFPGNLTITADSIDLNRQARINSSTEFVRGGDITLNVTGNITMRNNGDRINATEISSTAFNDANGGNITFNVSPNSFIIGNLFENSDVVATAEGIGKGGIVDAESAKDRIFLFREFNGQRTPESDFTAASALGLDGIVRGTQTDLQPQLPQQPVVRDIPQVCPASQGITTRQAGRSAYSNAGRGGLPPNPSDALDSNIPQIPWVTLDSNGENPTATNSTPATTSKPEVIEEAEGWVRQPNGKLLLTTKTSTVPSPSCIYQSSQQ